MRRRRHSCASLRAPGPTAPSSPPHVWSRASPPRGEPAEGRGRDRLRTARCWARGRPATHRVPLGARRRSRRGSGGSSHPPSRRSAARPAPGPAPGASRAGTGPHQLLGERLGEVGESLGRRRRPGSAIKYTARCRHRQRVERGGRIHVANRGGGEIAVLLVEPRIDRLVGPGGALCDLARQPPVHRAGDRNRSARRSKRLSVIRLQGVPAGSPPGSSGPRSG